MELIKGTLKIGKIIDSEIIFSPFEPFESIGGSDIVEYGFSVEHATSIFGEDVVERLVYCIDEIVEVEVDKESVRIIE